MDGNPRRLCGIYSRDGGWQIPAALQHVPPRDPDGTRTDSPQAADLHWAAHSTSPIPSLRSPAARRCDNCHEIVELDRDLGFGSHIVGRQRHRLPLPAGCRGSVPDPVSKNRNKNKTLAAFLCGFRRKYLFVSVRKSLCFRCLFVLADCGIMLFF